MALLKTMQVQYREKHPLPPPTDQCKYGHPLSGENLYIKTNGSRACKRCAADSQMLYRDRKADGITVQPTEERTHCPKGHEFTEQNSYVFRGVRQCKACRALQSKDRYQRMAAAKHAAKAPDAQVSI